MDKLQAEKHLREAFAAMPITDLALSVKVAGEAINDSQARTEVAGIVDMTSDDLLDWGERVIATEPHSESILDTSEVALGWYESESQD